MPGVIPHKTVVFGSLTLVVLLMVAGLPTAPANADPCALTHGASAVLNRVCLDGRTVVETDGHVRDVRADAHASVTFLTYLVQDGDAASARAVVTRDGASWSLEMPAGWGLGLRALAGGPHDWEVPVEDGPYRLVHLATPMLPEWQAALAGIGATVHAYVPTNHFVLRLADHTQLGALDTLTFIDAVGVVPAGAKVEPGLVEAGGAPKVNILYWPDAPGARESVLERLAALDAEVVQDAPKIERIQARLDAARIPRLAALPDVMWIDQAGEAPEADMDKIRVMTGAEGVQALSVPFDGTGVVGQVMDSELDTDHPDFQASLLIDYSAPQTPSTIHGSSVYGIVFGDGASLAAAKGMAPGAKGTFAQWFTDTRYNYAERMAQDYGGVFQTHSWGNSVPKDNTYDSFSNENDRVVQDLDVLMLQSMSNCGPQCARREAMAKNILSIGALFHYDTIDLLDDRWATGASTGPAADGRIKPDLVGPYDAILTTTRNGHTPGFGGTSGATPVVAGAVAITYQMGQSGLFHDIAAIDKPSTAKALLIASGHTYNPAQVVSTSTSQQQWLLEPYKRDIQGWGLPDLQRLWDGGGAARVIDGSVALTTGDNYTLSYPMPGGATGVRVSLVWSDVPANPGASPTLVNDLDLTVTVGVPGVDQQVFRGNHGLDQSPFSVPGGEADRLNNVENVILPALNTVQLHVRVDAAAVNLDADPGTPEVDQPFSLVVLPVP